MDIFDRIEQKPKIIYQDGLYSVQTFAEKKLDYKAYVKPKHKPCKQWSAEVQERTSDLYRYMYGIFSKGSAEYNKLSEQEKQEIYQNIEKMLKKGVNFDFFTDERYSDTFFYLKEDVLRLLYDYGYDMQKGFENAPIIYLYEKDLYDCLTTEQIIESGTILSNIPVDILKEICQSRETVCVDSKCIECLLDGSDYEYQTYGYAEKIELLFSQGFVKLTADQIERAMIRCKTDMISQAYGIVKKEKYTTKKSLEEKAVQKKDAKEKIQQILDDAQNAIS